MIAYKVVRRNSEGNTVSYSYTDNLDKYHCISMYPIVKYSRHIVSREVAMDIPTEAVPPDRYGPLYCFADEKSATNFMYIDQSYSENKKIYIKYRDNYELWLCEIVPSQVCNTGNAPQGTILADKVLLVRQVPLLPLYKVVRRVGSSLVSLSMSHGRVEFPVGVDVYPRIHCGPLCCTDTLENANTIVKDSLTSDIEVWKCLAAKSVINTVYFDTTPTKKEILGTSISSLPTGTVLADVVKITERIL